ncbi:MAG: hypothetical protein L0I79_04230 [Atopostipes sp.]|nr:hypothetical protein [Atopostipes sp.]
MEKKRTYLISFLSIILFIFTGCGPDKKQVAFNQFKEDWEEQNYEAMYSQLSKESKEKVTKEEFSDRYQVIYDAIEAKNIQIEKIEDEDKEDAELIDFRLSMDSSLSELTFDNYQLELTEEKQNDHKKYFVDWDESLIFPEMEADDEVRVETIQAQRGEIFDKEGRELAINGPRYNIGIHPARFNEDDLVELAETLDIDEEKIQEPLDQNTDPEYFVPIVKIAVDNKQLLDELLAIDGVVSQEVEDRLYPAGEPFGALIGYINPITAEELEEADEGIYQTTSPIGKAGLEKVYETELRAIDGKELYISKIEEDEEIDQISLAKKEAKDGEDLHLTIDAHLQEQIYNEVEGDTGTASAIHPLTGEVLALVSYPSYDSNLYRTYTPNNLRKEWEEMDESIFENRFNKTYSPGSTFKPVTAAIALEEGVLEADDLLKIEGKSWQKDSSWGDYKINRVSQELTEVDLKDAFIYSDNIYFAQQALKIGADKFIEETKKFGIGEEIPFDYPFTKSQIANGNKIDSDVLLADSGYGQGEVLISSLHLASIYSSFVNDGIMMEPSLEQKESEIWKDDLYSEENRKTLVENLISVIDNPNGTGQAAKIEDVTLAGKTGTVEFKQDQADDGKENGWFLAMDVEEPEIVLSIMIENVEDRGGSQYPLEKVKNILIDYFK